MSTDQRCTYIYQHRCWAPIEAHRGDTYAAQHDYQDGHSIGEPHRYSVVCDICGERGNVVLSIEPRAFALSDGAIR